MTGAQGVAAIRLRPGLLHAEWLILLAAVLPLLVGMVDLFGAMLALDEVQDEFGLGFDQLRWLSVALILPFLAAPAIAGRYADYVGIRRVLVGGLLLSALGSALQAAAPEYGFLIAGRIVMGAAAGVLAAGTLSIVRRSFARERLGTAFGIWALIGGAGLTAGSATADPSANAAAMRNVAVSESGEASGLNWTLRLTGSLIGIAGATSVFLARHHAIVTDERSARGVDASPLEPTDLGGLLEPSGEAAGLLPDPDAMREIAVSAFERAASTAYLLAGALFVMVMVGSLASLGRAERNQAG